MTNEKMENQLTYPLIALRGITVFPGMILHFDLNRKKSIAAVNAAMQNNQEVVVSCQRQTETDEPGMDDLYPEGTIVEIKQVTKLPGNLMRVMVEGKIAEEDAYVARTYRDAPNVDGYLFINTTANLMTGDLVKVQVTDCNEYDLIGEIYQED